MSKQNAKPKPFPESIIQSRRIRQRQADGWLVVKIIQCTLNGWPDLQCHKNGITEFDECKATNGRLSELQKYRHEQLRNAGFTVNIISS